MRKEQSELFLQSFFGPWTPIPGQTGPAALRERTRHHYLSIAHWYESCKFMPAHPDLRDSVLNCPTIKEARKFALHNKAQWRSDWNLVRHSFLSLGMGFLTLDRPDIGLEKWGKGALVEALGGMQIPERFLQAVVDRYVLWANGPKIGTFGAADAPDQVVGRKLTLVVSNIPSWTLISLCNNKTAWRVHDWALSMFIPVRYVGTANQRLTSSLVDDLLTKSSQMIVFEQRGGRGSDSILQKIRAEKIPLSLELYSAQQNSGLSLTD